LGSSHRFRASARQHGVSPFDVVLVSNSPIVTPQILLGPTRVEAQVSSSLHERARCAKSEPARSVFVIRGNLPGGAKGHRSGVSQRWIDFGDEFFDHRCD
jgi:hypothetical protein